MTSFVLKYLTQHLTLDCIGLSCPTWYMDRVVVSTLQHGQCSKKYPKPFIQETQQGADSYPLYKRRSPEDSEQVGAITLNVSSNWITQQIDNRWVEPYSTA